jgi:flavorubredoxin
MRFELVMLRPNRIALLGMLNRLTDKSLKIVMVSKGMVYYLKRAINTYTYLVRLLITKLEVGIFWSSYSGLTLDLTRLQKMNLEGRNVRA